MLNSARAHKAGHAMCAGVLAETQSAIDGVVRRLARGQFSPPPQLLDIGCWDGGATLRYAASMGAVPHGIEVFPEPAERARARGVRVASLDLERSPFPWERGTFDVVIANQVFEHLKNIWLPLAEVHRVLKPGGHFVISVPNLASLHNRVLLALGVQPTSIRTLGPHVRGYTLSELVALLRLDGAFAIRAVVGVGFYPFPARAATPLARLWPGASHTPVVVAEKVRDLDVAPWAAYKDAADSGQTFYG